MKFTAKLLSALAAGGLVLGALGAGPALAAPKKKKETDLIKIIDADLKRIDKAIVSLFTPPKK